PWSPVGDPIELATLPAGDGSAWTARLPAGLPFPALASLAVIVFGARPPEGVGVADRRLPVFSGGRHGRRWLTERVRLAQSPGEIALPGVATNAPRPRVRLLLWAGR